MAVAGFVAPSPTGAPRGVLRVATAGSVDDGKSTLIGRLLHDSRAIADDQLAALTALSRRSGQPDIDLSLLTDGLRAEREQGITIDVAYRYFATAARRFVIADTPGHVQYTRNMVTGCSTADVAVVLVDARRGPTDQTRRHIAVAALMRVPEVVCCINKMDLVDFREDAFTAIARELQAIARKLDIRELSILPVSALRGDNIVERSPATAWHRGPTLLERLHDAVIADADRDGPLRLPVQWVIRSITPTGRAERTYAGRIEMGSIRAGDAVIVLPGGRTSHVAGLRRPSGASEHAAAGESVAVRLTDDVDLGRGGLIAGIDDAPVARTEIEATACWMGRASLAVGRRYVLRHATSEVGAIVTSVLSRIDAASLERHATADTLEPNDLGDIHLRLAEPIYADAYSFGRATGSAILIDPATNDTVGAVLLHEQPARRA